MNQEYMEKVYGTLEYYEIVASKFDTILAVERGDQPGTLRLICRKHHDKNQIKRFAEKLEPGVDYEIVEVGVEKWIEKKLQEKIDNNWPGAGNAKKLLEYVSKNSKYGPYYDDKYSKGVNHD